VPDAAPDPLASRPWLSAYAEGVPDEILIPDTSLPEMMEAAVKAHSRRVALEFFGAETRYDELGEQISRVAGSLRRLGVKAGDRIALVLPNSPEHVAAFYAVLRVGAIVVEHNPLYTTRELRHQFEDHGARFAIVWDKIADTVAEFPADIRPQRIVSVDLTRSLPLGKRLALKLPLPAARSSRKALTTTPKSRGLLRWEQLVEGRRLPRKHPFPGVDDTAVLQYTSGTTGRPKGAILTHRNLHANAVQGRAWVPGLEVGREVFYGVLPFFHAYGMTLCLTFAMSIGARLVLFPKFDLDLVLTAAKKSPPTFLPAVPPIYDQLSRSADRRGTDLSSVRFAISGAMNLPVGTVTRWEQVTGGLLVEGYGMTESSPVALGNPIGPSRRPGTVGVPFPSTDIRVVDPDEPTRNVPLGEPGELLLRGPQVFQGYWNRPTETAETLLEGGWLRTGDIVTVAADGFVTIVDRRKELIITGGFNVSPSEVEGVLLTHPDVEAAAVVGLPRAGGGKLDAAGIRDFCRTHLAAYKVPKQVFERDELPRSLIGKVLRKQVRDELIASRP
jgi:long-chain acyl-CoA synthetase